MKHVKKRWLLVGLLAGMVIAWFAWRQFFSGPPRSQPLAPITESFNLKNLNAYLAMFSLVRSSLATYPDLRKAAEIPIDPDLPEVCDRPVMVSIYRENAPPLWGVGTPQCLTELNLPSSTSCFRDETLCAIYQITRQAPYKKFYMVKLNEVAVRFDIVNQMRPLRVSRNSLKGDHVEPGVHGLILQNGKQLTFQPPFAYITYSWETDERGSADRLRLQLEKLAESADLAKGSWSKYPLYRFTSLSILQHRPDFVPLFVMRDAPLIKKFGAREIGRAAIDSGRYLNKTFDFSQQRFRYVFNPLTLDKGGFLDYDTVHHAGTVYSLFKLYKASRKDDLVDVCQASFDFLTKHIEPPLLEPELLGVKRWQVEQLGAAAFTLLAVTELPDRLLKKTGVDRINRLARFLVEMQEEDGRFYDFYWQRLIGYMPRKAIKGFAGEALLALARYYKINPNVEWLHAARLAAKQQMALFAKTGVADPWTIQGLAELFDVDPDPQVASSCLAMADTLLKNQWGNPAYKNPVYPDYYGGFASAYPPRTSTAALQVEALLAAHWLAYKLQKDTKPYADAILAATHFVLQNQYRRDNTYYVNRPEETRGAFRGGLIDPEIRIDYNQHAIAALTGAYDIASMLETGTVPKEFEAEGTKELQDTLEMGGKVQ
ncbi:MAG: hypothetical protein GX444_03920 [Myxococcales bacterium]|nr:hypothetical protein [Myxococcales bacterium]